MSSQILEIWNKPTGKFLYILAAAILIIGALWKIPQWQVRAYHGRLDAGAISKLDPKELIQLQKDLITAENNARLALAQIIGGLVVLLGLYATFKNVRVAEEGKLTERFSKAVELLGNENLDVRLGGIYALERIAKDSQKDHWTVIEVLAAFIREQSRSEHIKWQSTKPPYLIRADIQAAITVIGRRKWIDGEIDFQHVQLNVSFLGYANFFQANLCHASFVRTNLREANFILANLTGADLRDSILSGAHMAMANLTNAKLNGTTLKYTDLSNTTGLTWEQLLAANLDKTTKLPPDLEERRKKEQESKAPRSPGAETDGGNQSS